MQYDRTVLAALSRPVRRLLSRIGSACGVGALCRHVDVCRPAPASRSLKANVLAGVSVRRLQHLVTLQVGDLPNDRANLWKGYELALRVFAMSFELIESELLEPYRSGSSACACSLRHLLPAGLAQDVGQKGSPSRCGGHIYAGSSGVHGVLGLSHTRLIDRRVK